MSAHDTASTTNRGAQQAKQRALQIHEPIEWPKWVTVAGKPELALNAEHEVKLLTANKPSDNETVTSCVIVAADTAPASAKAPKTAKLSKGAQIASRRGRVMNGQQRRRLKSQSPPLNSDHVACEYQAFLPFGLHRALYPDGFPNGAGRADMDT